MERERWMGMDLPTVGLRYVNGPRPPPPNHETHETTYAVIHFPVAISGISSHHTLISHLHTSPTHPPLAPRSHSHSSAPASFSDPARNLRRTCAPIPSVHSLPRKSTHGCRKTSNINHQPTRHQAQTQQNCAHLCPSRFGYPSARNSDEPLRFRLPCPRSSPSCEGRTHSSSWHKYFTISSQSPSRTTSGFACSTGVLLIRI